MRFAGVMLSTITIAGYTLVFWLPQTIHPTQGFGEFGIGLLTALPRLCAILAIALVGKVSDRFGHCLSSRCHPIKSRTGATARSTARVQDWYCR